MELNSKNIKKILLLLFCGALIFSAFQNLGSVFSAVGRIISLLSPVIAALCIAFVLNVLLSALENKAFAFMVKSKKRFIVNMRRPLCLVLTYLIAFGIIALLILFIIPDLADTVVFLADKIPVFVIQLRDWIEGILKSFNISGKSIPALEIDWNSVASNIKDWVTGSSGKIFGGAVGITTSVFSGVFDGLFSIVISVYILAQKERIGAFVKRVIDAFIPTKATSVIYHISACTHNLFSRFIGGQLTESLILGILCFIGMSIFRFPNALIISVFISITSLVPIVGATVGVIIGFLLIVITQPLKAVFFVVFFLILQQVEGNLIYPKVVGKAVGLPGVIVVSAVLVGGNIGGVLGGLIAVPTCAVLYTLLKEAVDYRRKKRVAIIETKE